MATYRISYLSSTISYLKKGELAQLARAPALHAGGQRFESVILHVSGDAYNDTHQKTPEKEFFDILKEKKNYKRRQQYRDNAGMCPM